MIVSISSKSSPEEIKKALQKIQKGVKVNKRPGKSFDAFKYCGTIKLKEDPVAVQKNMRNEGQ